MRFVLKKLFTFSQHIKYYLIAIILKIREFVRVFSEEITTT